MHWHKSIVAHICLQFENPDLSGVRSVDPGVDPNVDPNVAFLHLPSAFCWSNVCVKCFERELFEKKKSEMFYNLFNE